MRTIKLLSLVFISACCTVFAGIQPYTKKLDLVEVKSIDLIFANGFEAPLVPSLSSENVFVGDLPELESGHDKVGMSPGAFSVDQTGQAYYEYPIFAGVGTAGVAPKISLRYSSASGNGHVGVGWAISGVTVISRCRETEESRDGIDSITPKPITYGDEDKFCLNGERLFVSNDGTYGSDETEYRTEREQFARITSYDTTDNDNNPDYFTVERRDGSISYYGNTANSEITVTRAGDNDVDGKTYTWAINRYQDTMGNYIDYDYEKFSDTEFVLTDIDYTGNASAQPALLPYNNIKFIYEARVDEFTSYLGGVPMATTQRLASIESRIDDVLVRDYTLDYSLSSTSARSKLDSIMECSGDDCLPLTSFEWSTPNKVFRAIDSCIDTPPNPPNNLCNSFTFPSDIETSKLGDINADGRADLVYVNDNDNNFRVALANGQIGFQIASNTGVSKPSGDEIDNKWHLIDYNADGRQDLLKQVNTSWFVYLAQTGTIGFSNTGTPVGFTSAADSDFQIVDINGDGLSDLLYAEGEVLKVRYLEYDDMNNTYQFSSSRNVRLPSNANQIIGMPNQGQPAQMKYRFHKDNDIYIQASDINGDGVADLLLRGDVCSIDFNAPQNIEEIEYEFYSASGQSDQCGQETLLSSHWIGFVGNGVDNQNREDYFENYYIVATSTLLDNADEDIRFADFNSDGLTDVIAKNTSNNWQFRLSTGKGWTAFSSDVAIQNEDQLQLIDYNLDGYVDLIYPNSAGTQDYVSKTWEGNGFSATSTNTGAEAINFNQNLNLFVDLNGDGANEHLRIDEFGTQFVYPRITTFLPSDRVNKFTNGLGASNEVLYRPLTFSTTYKQGNYQSGDFDYGEGSPVLDVMGAIYVVRQVDTDSPVEGDDEFQNTIRYQYENARVQTGGRGFLGFEKVITETPVYAESDTEAKVLQSITTYRQDFPYNGIPAGTTVTQLDDDFYQTEPPVCDNSTDECFPPSCPPGEICNDPQRLGGTETLLSEVINVVDSSNPTTKSSFPFIESTETKTYSPETGDLLKTVTQTSTHDSFGNPTLTTQVVKDGAGNTLQTNTVDNDYLNFTDNGRWLIGLLDTTTVTKQRTGLSAVITEMEYSYDETTGLLTEEINHPNEGDELYLRVLHEYDQYGNEVKVISCSKDLIVNQNQNQCRDDVPVSADDTNPDHVHRFNELTYSDSGRYVDSTFNTIGQKITDVLTRDDYGNPLTTIDILGRTTTNTYDSFGRLTSSRNDIGEWTQTSRAWCSDAAVLSSGSIACPKGREESIRVRQMASGGAVSYSYLDFQGREIASISKSFNASDDAMVTGDERWVMNQVWFDQYGRQVKSQGPHFVGANDKPTTTTEFDRYSRPTKVTLPDGTAEEMAYDGFVTTLTNGNTHRKQETKNALGQLIEVKDFDNDAVTPTYQNTLSYTYNSLGLLTEIKRTTDGDTELLIKNEYDIAGRKTMSNDVDTGIVTSIYNPEGEMIETEDAKGQIFRKYRDTLGRVYQSESWQNGTTPLTRTENEYNLTNGLLTVEKRYIGNEVLFDYRESHFYDSLNRASSTQVNFKETNGECGGLNCDYTANIYYDEYSRIKYQQDVSGEAIENHYTTDGYLNRITDAADANKEYYQINETDKWGNVTQDRKAGNNDLITDYAYDADRGWIYSVDSIHQTNFYDFDDIGNLVKRYDTDNNQAECFQYDRLNRLRFTYRFNNANQNCSITAGNIETQEIKYDGSGNITEKNGLIYSYDDANENTIGLSPHQVQSVGNNSYFYDDNGNLTQSQGFITSNGVTTTRNMKYTAYNKVSQIYTGSENNPFEVSDYRYDTSENRFSRKDTNADGEVNVTHFIGNVEVEYNSNGQIAFKRQLGNYAVITETNSSTQETFLFSDHLGSIDVITDENGKMLQSMSFDAWGKRRLPANWAQMSNFDTRNYLSDYTTRGFTGHEMLDTFGIINMGGRIYDAVLGRVLQADPIVQDPTASQQYNRYSYVLNNPLSYTDPSGYSPFRQFLGTVVGAVIGAWLGPWATNWAKAFIVGFASATAASLVITGNLRSSLKSGLIAGAIAVIGFALSTESALGSADTESQVTGGEKHTTTGTASENSHVNSEVTPSSSGAVVEQTSINSGGESAFGIADQMEGINYGRLTGNEIDAGTASFSYNHSGIAFNPYTLFEASLLTGLMAGAISATNAGLWATEFKLNINTPRNTFQLGVEIENVANPFQYTSNLYDQGVFTALKIADKISMATGIVGLTKGAAQHYSKKYLYRAVSKAELDDIAKYGLRNQPSSNSYETGKLFANSADDAAQFGKNNYLLDNVPNTIIRVEVPRDVLAGSFKFTADGMSAVSISANQLHKLTATALKYSPVR